MSETPEEREQRPEPRTVPCMACHGSCFHGNTTISCTVCSGSGIVVLAEDAPQKPVAELLAEYTTIIQKQGTDSVEAKAFVIARYDNRELLALCGVAAQLWDGLKPIRDAHAAWQPIDTAPRDGTSFLASLSNGRVVILRSPPVWAVRCVWWISDNIGVSVPVAETHVGYDLSNNVIATHWQPLPEPPADHHK